MYICLLALACVYTQMARRFVEAATIVYLWMFKFPCLHTILKYCLIMSCRARWETSTDGGAWRWGSFVVCCYHWATTRRTFRGEPNQGVCAIVCVCVCVLEQMAGCLNKWAYQMSGAGEYARFLTSYRKYTDIRVSSLLALICLLTSCRAVWQLQRNRFIYMIYCNCFGVCGVHLPPF